ncbi:cytochrome c [Novosphingobium flavum]|uniref:cytochrome c n=1 Tax=Novosphingobium aerophilum TaxID=2839843 RepID=UPI00163B3E3B|nr:cytochrome c [Novosphingobium aerophilum]MBC2661486.1 cytochrome c [Novosphingobium aerophilum]
MSRAALVFAASLLGSAVLARAEPAAIPAAPPPPLDPAQVLAAFAPGPGREVTAAACGQCHAPSLITGKHLDSEAWAQLVDQMISRGAPVEDKDYDTIVDYLTRNYGPAKG